MIIESIEDLWQAASMHKNIRRLMVDEVTVGTTFEKSFLKFLELFEFLEVSFDFHEYQKIRSW